MGNYDIYVFCNECFDVHRVGTGVPLEDGPNDKRSIGSVYAGKQLPPSIEALLDNDFECPETGKTFAQEDNSQVFLVPVVFV